LLSGGQFITSIAKQAPELFKNIVVTLSDIDRTTLQSIMMLTLQQQQQQQNTTNQSRSTDNIHHSSITKDIKAHNRDNNEVFTAGSNNSKPVMKMTINMDKYKK